MSNQSFGYNFKFVYNEGNIRYCAYINHCLSFAELKEFLDYWICNLKCVPFIAPRLYWIDAEGDKFTVTNEMEYKMFKARNALDGILFGTSNGIKRSITSPVSATPYTHFCENCESCQHNKYIVNAKGEMICMNCAHKRGFCCLLVIEGASFGANMSNEMKDLFEAFCENEPIYDNPDEELPAGGETQPPKKDDEVDTVVVVSKPAADINGCLENMRINQETVCAVPKKSTGAIPKIRKNAYVTLDPSSVKDSLEQMMAMGFDNEQLWLTDLLMSTKGNISKALDRISGDPAYRKRKLF